MFDKFFKKDSDEINWEYVESIPQFGKLKDCEQNPKWHSEGNAWNHTRRCVDAAYDLLFSDARYEKLNKRVAVLCALFHDIGKGVTTQWIKNNWHAYGHEFEGEKIARAILWDYDISIRERICSCARYHMKALDLSKSRKVVDELISLSRMPFFRWDYVLFTKHCDILGSIPEDPKQTYGDNERLDAIWRIADRLHILDNGFYCGSNDAYDLVHGTGLPIDWDGTGKGALPVFMLIGLPGAGKNTYIERMGESRVFVTLSRDDIRAELGYCSDGDKVVLSPDKEAEVTRVFNERFIESVKNGKSVCLNNLNIKKKYRDGLKNLVKGYNIEWIYVYVEAPTIEDNEERRPTFEPGSIRAMTGVLDWPTADEYYRFVVSKQ